MSRRADMASRAGESTLTEIEQWREADGSMIRRARDGAVPLQVRHQPVRGVSVASLAGDAFGSQSSQ